MAITREIVDGLMKQGANEEISYQLTTTNWGVSPSAVTAVVKDIATDEVVTSTVLPGTATVLGDVITLPLLKNLTAGRSYRVEVKFSAGGNVWEAYAYIQAEE